MEKPQEICEMCNKPRKECDCCEGCGHMCLRDYGHTYCPVCFPEPKPDDE